MKSTRTENFLVGIAKAIGPIFFAAILISTILLPAASAPTKQPYNGLYCAILVPGGTQILSRGSYKTPDGTVRTWIPGVECPGELVDRAPNIYGWVEYSYYNMASTQTFTSIDSTWYVNATAPSSTTNSPTTFLWNGLCNTTTTGGVPCDGSNSLSYIVQPVLAWGCMRYTNGSCASGTGTFWWATPVVDHPYDGTFWYNTPFQNLNLNDKIEGIVTRGDVSPNCSSSGNIGETVIVKKNGASSPSMILCDNSNYYAGLAAVLEAKALNGGLTSCKQFPTGNPSTGFASIVFNPVTSSGSVSVTSWNSKVVPSLNPNCNFAMYPADGTSGSPPIKLYWDPTLP